MDISHLLLVGEEELKDLDNPRLETEVLLAGVLELDRAFIKSNPKTELSKQEETRFLDCIQQRKDRVPVAYIQGFKDWAGLKIKVNKNVLIPRDETELLVQKICSRNGVLKLKSVLDIGTGSGNIAIFLAKNLIEAEVTALDNSGEALKVVEENVCNLGVKNIKLIKSDLLSEIPQSSSFDLIIANLPYVPEEIEVSLEVKKEPRRAVFAGLDGLDVIRELAAQIKDKQITFKELWLEFLPDQKQKIANIFSDYKIEFFNDIEGEVRFAKIS